MYSMVIKAAAFLINNVLSLWDMNHVASAMNKKKQIMLDMIAKIFGKLKMFTLLRAMNAPITKYSNPYKYVLEIAIMSMNIMKPGLDFPIM